MSYYECSESSKVCSGANFGLLKADMLWISSFAFTIFELRLLNALSFGLASCLLCGTILMFLFRVAPNCWS